jgi:hypothetical protein
MIRTKLEEDGASGFVIWNNQMYLIYTTAVAGQRKIKMVNRIHPVYFTLNSVVSEFKPSLPLGITF